MSEEKRHCYSKLSEKSWNKVDQLRKKAQEAARHKDMIGCTAGDVMVPLNVESNTLLLEALRVYEESLKKQADSIANALNCGDEYGYLESHDEKRILKGCMGLMQEMVERVQQFCIEAGVEIKEPEKDKNGDYVDDEWYLKWFRYEPSWQHIIEALFLSGTHHGGFTSCMAKCRELGVADPYDDRPVFEFDPEMDADNDLYWFS